MVDDEVGRGGVRPGDARRYRGPDRRRPTDPPRLAAGSWLALGLLVCVLTVGLGWARIDREAALTSLAAITAARAATLVVALALAAICYLHGRATGAARSLRMSTASGALSAMAAVDLWSGAEAGSSSAALRFALLLYAACWMIGASVGPDVDTAIRPARDAIKASGIVVACWSVIAIGLPAIEVSLTDPILHGSGTGIWILVALAALTRRSASPSAIQPLLGWSALGLGASEAARVAGVFATDAWLLTAGVVAAATLLAAVLGWAHDLARSAIVRREVLHTTELEQVRHRDDDQSAARERTHEIRNALLLIEGAIVTLERHRDHLSANDLRTLTGAVASGLGHLRELIEPEDNATERVSLLDLARERALLARTRGIDVDVRGDDPAETLAREAHLAQVLDNLLANAGRHGAVAGRCVVRIDVRAQADRVLLFVSDHGPGIPSAHREQVFEAGVRLHPGRAGHGLGLHVARDLVRQHGGDLWAEAATSGGACLVVALPRLSPRTQQRADAARADDDAQEVDEQEHGVRERRQRRREHDHELERT